MTRTLSGIDHLLSQPEKYLTGKTVGLVANHTSLTKDGKHSIAHFHSHSAFTLQALFAPEHGFYGTAQDMIHITNEVDPLSGLNINSLYGKNEDSLIPDPSSLKGIDNLVFDIQDVGSRYYTFIYTMANCMTICKQAGTRMVVCDRPNPINGISIEGNLVGGNWRSFVGQYSLPNRHGMTVGELALLFNDHFDIHCDLKVVPMTGWEREMWYDQTGMVWTPPSPNMPTLTTATVYPGMCLIEGTLLSEGRGTTPCPSSKSVPLSSIHATWLQGLRKIPNSCQECFSVHNISSPCFKSMPEKFAPVSSSILRTGTSSNPWLQH